MGIFSSMQSATRFLLPASSVSRICTTPVVRYLHTPFPTSTQARRFSSTRSTMSSITDWVSKDDKSGEFKRQVSAFRDSISREAGAKYPPEKGRYHLYVSYACPWAHRTLIARKLKGLEDIISFSVVHWHLGEGGWRFASKDDPKSDTPGDNVVPDPIEGLSTTPGSQCPCCMIPRPREL